jgi:hypothetical protein
MCSLSVSQKRSHDIWRKRDQRSNRSLPRCTISAETSKRFKRLSYSVLAFSDSQCATRIRSLDAGLSDIECEETTIALGNDS